MLTHDNHLWNVVNSLSFGRGPARDRRHRHRGADVPHRWARRAHPAVAVRRRDERHPAVVRPGADAGDDGERARHGAVPGAGHVGGAHGGPGLRRPRPVVAGARGLRRRAVPAAGDRLLPGQGTALPGGLRHDRDRAVGDGARRRPRQGEGGLDRPGGLPRRDPHRRRRRRGRARSTRSASCSSAGRTCSPATGGCPRRRPRRSAAAGSTPATWAGSTPRASSRSSTARRT